MVKSFDRRPNRTFPMHTLEQTLVIAICIQDKNAGKPMKRLLIADAIGRKPTSPQFRDLLSSSYKYGLTIGTEKAEYIQLTELGQKITKPTSSQMKAEATQIAALTPEIFGKIYNHYKDSKFPTGQFFENTLETSFGVSREYVKEVSELLYKNGRFAEIIRDISGSPHIILDSPVSEDISSEIVHAQEIVEQSNEPVIKRGSEIRQEQRPIFIAHGKNKKPLEQLKKILDQFKIPYKIAVDEPNSGRPISQKVRELMNGCGAAIFIFSKDGERLGDDKETIPNQNVVFELGAASVLYGEKVVIFKETGINFPSDFNSLGHISFETDKLDSNAMDLLKELIAMGFVKITTA